jgi:hypothetical protein
MSIRIGLENREKKQIFHRISPMFGSWAFRLKVSLKTNPLSDKKLGKW